VAQHEILIINIVVVYGLVFNNV